MNSVEFSFEADESGKSYGLRIARTMVRLFDIPLSRQLVESIENGRTNRFLGQIRFIVGILKNGLN
jgi:hypothetical protein